MEKRLNLPSLMHQEESEGKTERFQSQVMNRKEEKEGLKARYRGSERDSDNDV